MTALVSIMNKKAAVLAADSAVTSTKGGKTKIYNTANKIFRLSDNNPVGVMIYDSADFMNIPWELLFKLYKDHRSERSFDTLKGYADDFINFLKREKHCNSAENQLDWFSTEMYLHYYKVKEIARRETEAILEDNPEADARQVFQERIMENIRESNEAFTEDDKCSELEDYKIREIKTYGKEFFDRLMKDCEEEEIPGTREEWEENIYNYVRSQKFYEETGLVFVGYGDDDIFPSKIPVHIAGLIDGRLRYYYDELESITYDNKASIHPFAQTDIMMSLMKGVHPEMYDTVLDNMGTALESTRNMIVEAIKAEGADETLAKKVSELSLSEVYDKFNETNMDYIQNTFVDGIVDAVASFNIEDMVKMAESLISITNLQRHFSSSEESVGGPVDVAVITKSEGFIWVKHKQWFQQEMNTQIG